MQRKRNLVMLVFGIVAILGGALTLASTVPAIFSFIEATQAHTTGLKPVTWVFAAVTGADVLVGTVLFIFLGIRMVLGREYMAARLAHAIVPFAVVQAVGYLILRGLGPSFVMTIVEIAILVVLATYLDPDLAAERRAEKLMRKRVGAVERMEREKNLTAAPAKGYISLNFFNLFWIFVICSVLGLVIETVYHMTIYDPGVYQDRAGLLFGPFSPIYGFGGVLLTVALNRFHDKPWWLIFLVSAVIGGAFEYFVSWIMQFAFGIQAWDYSGTFLSIGGRTNFMFMCFWGILGLAWVKLLLPRLLKLVRAIPWNWRYGLTTVCAILMLVDCIMTVQSIDCWYLRESGKTPDTAVEKFYAAHFDNAYMQDRFQSMSMDPKEAARV
jgi:uncharacterized membrane protein